MVVIEIDLADFLMETEDVARFAVLRRDEKCGREFSKPFIDHSYGVRLDQMSSNTMGILNE